MRRNKLSKIAVVFSMVMMLSITTMGLCHEDPPLLGGPTSDISSK